MTLDQTSQPYPPEQVIRLDDPDSGLSGVIVLNSTKFGPAAGGCRIWSYAAETDATIDAMRLAEGMTYKNALAGLPLGGGKAVIRAPQQNYDRKALFRAFGRAVASLDGRYVTAEDVGTSVDDMVNVAEVTPYVAGLPPKPGTPGGDPSPWTALGVFRAMEVALRRRLGAEIGEVTVAVQGLGHGGYALCELLHEAGARLIVAERRSDVAARAAATFGAEVMTSQALVASRADVFAPCALGAVLDADTVPRLRAKVVCGAANNQLAALQQGADLAARGILYAPDYLVNAGGIINVAAEYLGWSEAEARRRVEAIGEKLEEVLDFADRRGLASHEASDVFARSIIDSRGPAALAA